MNIKYIKTTDNKKYDLRDKRITDTDAGIATQSANGLLSSGDKKKLDGIASGAEVNQNAFSNIKIGNTTISADGKTDTVELTAGNNITLTPDATNDKITIAATDTWRPLGTGASDACAGNDSRLSDARPASDVYSWAKASTKPSYTASEVGATAQTINKTWSELKAMRDGGTLVPGQWYRITDYVTTTMQVNTQSAGHAFDIIVRADDASTLNENAYAAKHAGDTYFANSNLAAWRLRYCLDNINWSLTPQVTCTFTRNGSSWNNIQCIGTEEAYGGLTWYKWDFSAYGEYIYSSYFYTQTLNNNETAYANSMGQWTNVGTISNVVTSSEYGKGTILWMKDEFNNECSYDFKNIQFKRWKVSDTFYDGNDNLMRTGLNDSYFAQFELGSKESTALLNALQFITSQQFIWAYTFSSSATNQTQTDYSLLPDKVYNNVICGTYNTLMNNVFYGTCYNNTIGFGFQYNTINSTCHDNNIGCNVEYNIIGSSFYNNEIADKFSWNGIGINFYENVIQNSFTYNKIGNYFHDNEIARGFYYNSTYQYVYSNFIQNDCSYNIFNKYFRMNHVGNSVNNITIDCQYVQNSIIESGVKYVKVVCGQTPSNSSPLRYIKLCTGVAGSDSNTKTISHPSTNDTFLTEYKATGSQVINV